MVLDFVNKILALGAIGSQIFIVLIIAYFLFYRKNHKINNFFVKNGVYFAFFVALVAMMGSLFYSNIAGFVPCPLCWFQRIFMYPEVIVLGLALLKKDEKIIDYSLALSAAGWIISAYHNYIYFKGLHSLVCTSAESCTTTYFLEYGYITISMMALTAFSLIILLLINKKVCLKK